MLKRRQYNQWETLRPTLTWWRMRYRDASAATRGLQTIIVHMPDLLLPLCWQSLPIPALHIGLPATHRWCVEALRPYGVWLSSVETPTGVRIAYISGWRKVKKAWPTPAPRIMLLAGDQLYTEKSVDEIGEDNLTDVVNLPTPVTQGRAHWQLPTPVLGTAVTLAPEPVRPLPTPLFANSEQSRTVENSGVLLGNNGNTKIYAPAHVQVWGDRAALHGWTIQLILHELAQADRPLVVIDGRGDMAAQLPLYKPFVTALKAQQLHYVHMEDDLRQQGFNPLQPLAWEPVERTAERWLRWLNDLGVWPAGIAFNQYQLCLDAVNSGVDSLSTLARWLRQGADIPQAAHSHIQRALRQVQQSRRYATWLRRPRPLLARPLGLIFACTLGAGSVKRTMTAALLNMALTMPEMTLVLTGVPIDLLQAIPQERLPQRVVMVNGVILADSLVGIGRISNANKRQQMVQQAFGNVISQTDIAEVHERVTIAPTGSLFWLTNPPVQTTLLP